MIEQLIKLKKYIKLALADLGKSDFYSEEMFIVLEDILKILKPTELAVKKLNKDEATLLTSEDVFLFLFFFFLFFFLLKTCHLFSNFYIFQFLQKKIFFPINPINPILVTFRSLPSMNIPGRAQSLILVKEN
jgi:hypothetical protein